MIKKILFLVLFGLFLLPKTISAQNCPTYATNVISSFFSCADQIYFFEVANTSCPGTISFTVSGSYGLFEGGAWQVTSNLTGDVIASGNETALFGGNFTVNVGPLDPSAQGLVYTLNPAGVFTNIQVTQSGNIVASGGPIIFQPNVNISAATLTVTTPTGDVSNVVQNCRNFKAPINLQSPNFCSTIELNLPWVITCNVTGATLSSGIHPLTLYPNTPDNTSDLVDIAWNANTCQWDVTGANDCNISDIGSIFTITPDPFAPSEACSAGSQVFTVNYSGVPNGPDCCSTAGPLIPIEQNESFVQSNAIVVNSPFGGTNNSALITVPANQIGGQATSVNLNVSMAGYCFDPPGPGAGTGTSFWVTVYVDGIVIHDVQYTTVNNVNLNFTLANIPNGFDENSIVEVYIYPNTFNSAPPNPINTTYNPNANCASLTDGHWNVSSFDVTLTATYTEVEQTAISCEYLTLALPKTCCTPQPLNNVNENVCNGLTGSLTTWQANLEQTITSCLVFSSVTPSAGSVLPDNIFPNGNNTTCQPITQSVSAYSYCDTDGSGTVNTGDTYTLISTFTLTVNPSAPDLVETDGECGVAPSAELFCNGSLILSEIGIAPIELCGNGVNTTDINGNFSVAQITTALGNANSSCYTNINYSATASCAETPIEDGEFNITTLYCEGETVDLLPTTSNNGIVGTWAPSTISNTTSQTYTFTPNNTDCSNPVSIDVTVVEAPNAGSDGDFSICEGVVLTEQELFSALGNSPDLGGVWTPAVTGAATYTYTVTGTSPCLDASAQVEVSQYPSTTILLEANPDTIIFLDSATLTVTGGETFVWSPIESSDASVTVSPLENTTYNVTVTDEFGCVEELSLTVFVNYLSTTIALPDAFTPNNDGNNDVFEVFNKQDFSKIEMRIYDRWGELVHEGFDQNHGWNGTFKNKPMNTGMYVYYVFAETLSGQQIKVSSSVSLIR